MSEKVKVIMLKPKVSVIVPVYNVSKYLEKCLDSIVNQTLKNIEIIIINDCSPDPNDDLICQKYAAEDQRIVYIKHVQNLGPGGARNTGIKKAKAEYLTFIDSDDFIAEDLHQICYEEMVTNDRDVVVFNFEQVDEDLNILSTPYLNVDTTGDLLKNFLEDKNTVGRSVWNKMWKKSLFTDKKIEFPLDLYYEDLIVIPQLLYYTKNIVVLDRVFYYYLKREGSIIHSSSPKHIDDIFNTFSQISVFLQSVGKLDVYIEPLRAIIWGMIRYYIKTGLEGASLSTRKEMLSYIANKVISENFADANYYFPHRYY